jgi:hypothetical protein
MGGGNIDDIVTVREILLPQVSRPIQFPEPSLKLNLESRSDSQKKMFKHIHQSCVLHRENFCAGSQIKLVYLLDGYIEMAHVANPPGIYMAARSMLEFNAFLHEVYLHLRDAAAGAGEKWLDGGRSFFATIVRARFATSRNEFKSLLETQGLPNILSKPWRAGACVKGLEREADFADVQSRYEILCDYVHHNLSSSTTANAGSAVAGAALSEGGGMLIMPKPGLITQYQYPVPTKAILALEHTAPGFLQDAKGCLRWINEMPASPFSPDIVQSFTGTMLGAEVVRVEKRPVRPTADKISRNDLCPCGSGKKYKNCCLQ